MPEISVVLPVYKADQYIEECIQSVLDQTFTDFEFIIVVNGDHQLTIEKIEKFKDARIKRFYLAKPDIVDAINLAILKSCGTFIARIDGDDVMPTDRLNLQRSFLIDNADIAVVSGEITFLGDKKKSEGYNHHVTWLNSLKTHHDIFLNRFVDAPVANPSLMMRRELFEKYGLYQAGEFPEDYEMMLRWLHEGVNIGKIKNEALIWRDHPERATRNLPAYSAEAFMQTKSRFLAHWFEKMNISKEIIIWGNGRTVRQKAAFLMENGFTITGYIDIKVHTGKTHGIPVYHYQHIPTNKPVISLVGDRKGRLEIHRFLQKEGFDFYMLS